MELLLTKWHNTTTDSAGAEPSEELVAVMSAVRLRLARHMSAHSLTIPGEFASGTYWSSDRFSPSKVKSRGQGPYAVALYGCP